MVNQPMENSETKISIESQLPYRTLKGVWKWISEVSAVGLVLFYIYCAGFGTAGEQYHVGLYLLLTFVLIGLLYRFRQSSPESRPSLADGVLIVMTICTIGYWIVEYNTLANRAGAYSRIDVLVGGLAVLLSLEYSRRTVGWALTIIVAGGILYALFGRSMPSIIAHRGFTLRRIVEYSFFSQAGIFGIMANVMATYVILFIFFGAFLEKSGVGQFFIDLPMALAGRTVGGPAKVAVVASGFFGSVTGSAIANTVATGAFTIPLMKRTGFRPHIAGAIEATASVGGQFLPPVMGAGAFIMAERTELPYSYIALVSVIPALLYFFSVWVMVHLEAKKWGIKGLPKEELPHLPTLLKRQWYCLLPLVTLIAALIAGYTASKAAFFGILATITVSYFRRETRLTPKRLWEAMVTGAKNSLAVGGAVGSIGVIIAVIDLTGLGRIFPGLVLSIAGSNGVIAILLLAVASLILGMGIPVTAAYLITSELAVPILTSDQIGISFIAAHLIIFWLSQDSNITPPVALGAYAGAAIARADPWRTGWACFKFAKLLYVMPLLFAYTHILFDGTLLQNVLSVGTAAVGTFIFSIVTMGYFRKKTTWLEWILLAIAALFAYIYNVYTFVLALAMLASVYFMQKRRKST
ncbi:MAG: TRAP transporter permease [Candidatus Poribacteria bacterium]|nr:TRAP transporter permease [Candidatus Poribacteria bacterium]